MILKEGHEVLLGVEGCQYAGFKRIPTGLDEDRFDMFEHTWLIPVPIMEQAERRVQDSYSYRRVYARP